MRSYNPSDWYWQADDDRLYGSARQALVADVEDDEEYEAWSGDGNSPTRWPSDDVGVQTDAALQDVLSPYGLALWPVPPKEQLSTYAADKRWQVETGGITVAGVPVATDDRSKIMIIGARVKADADPAFTTPWIGADGSINVINAATAIVISDEVLAHVAACFEEFKSVLAGIEAGTITASAEIDAANWPS